MSTGIQDLKRVTSPYRCLATLGMAFTLCVLAVAESTGAAVAPKWFLALSIPILTEWIGEWLAYWRKQGVV